MTRSARIYAWTLRAYSRALRLEYGDAMVAAFVAMVREAHARDVRFAAVRVWLRVAADLLRTVPADLLRSGPRRFGARPVTAQEGSMETRFQDVRYALRGLRRQPLFTIVAALTIAIGVGATTTIFSIANALLLRAPAGVREHHELITVHRVAQDGSGFHAFGIPHFRHLVRSSPEVDLAAHDTFMGGTLIDGTAERVAGTLVSGNYFDLVGARPAAGRFFTPAEDSVPGRDPVCVISYALWLDRFSADPGLLGDTLMLNGRAFTVLGVAEEGFAGHVAMFPTDVWVPLAAQGTVLGRADLSEESASTAVEIVGRVAGAATRERTQEQLDAAGLTFAETRGEQWFGVEVLPYAPVVPMARGGAVAFLAALFAVAGVLLTITAVNVANMLLSRGASRTREVGIRLAVGATRRRLVAQLLTESLVLFVFGGALGAAGTWFSTRLIAAFPLPIPIPIDLHFSPDVGVMLFALGIAGATGIVFGLSPALSATSGDLVSALKDSTARAHGGRRLRAGLVVIQVAGSCVLLVAAGLLVRSLAAAGAADVGFETEGVMTYMIDQGASTRSADEAERFLDDLLRAARAIPGVEAAAMIDVVPLSGGNQQTPVVLPELPFEPDVGLLRVEFARITPGYFATVRMPLLAGSDFDARHVDGAPGVAVVNETFARRAWPDDNAIGKRFRFGSVDNGTHVEVVGVARDSKVRSAGEAPRFMVYVPRAQFGERDMTLLARVADPAAAVALRQHVQDADPVLPPPIVLPLAEQVGLSMLPGRFAAILAATFGAVGLLLAAIGLYGLLAYSVVQRRPEIGVRLALGAGNRDVRRMVVRDGLRLTSIGLGVGLLAAFGVAQLLRGMLFGVGALDPVTYGGIVVILMSVATLACWIPAHRAAAIDPVQALRAE